MFIYLPTFISYHTNMVYVFGDTAIQVFSFLLLIYESHIKL